LKSDHIKRTLITCVKFALSAALIGYLVIDAQRNETFADLVNQPKHWGLLSAAWMLCMLAVLLTIVRWYLLVRALDLPFKMRDALRLGFLGYLFNFISLGSVGGDLFKAVFLAREQHGRRAESVATVLADRIVGLYSLFLVAAGAILCFGQLNSSQAVVRDISQAVLLVTMIGTAGVAVLLAPGFTNGRLSQWLSSLDRAGPVFSRLFSAVAMYRRKPNILLATVGLSLLTHFCSTFGFYMISRGLPDASATLVDHFVIVPLGMLAGVVPLPLNALGAVEVALEKLYLFVPAAVAGGKSQGLLVAIVYRLITIGVALVGAYYYLGYRREVADVLKTAEAEQEAANEMPASIGRSTMVGEG
jgi:uncharacterized membrane protein YbhN (UPF0104 family)